MLGVTTDPQAVSGGGRFVPELAGISPPDGLRLTGRPPGW